MDKLNNKYKTKKGVNDISYYKIQNDLFRKEKRNILTKGYPILKNNMFIPTTIIISMGLNAENISMISPSMIFEYFNINRTSRNMKNIKDVIDFYLDNDLAEVVDGTYESINDIFFIHMYFDNGFFQLYDYEVDVIKDYENTMKNYIPYIMFFMTKANMYNLNTSEENNYTYTDRVSYAYVSDRTTIVSPNTISKYIKVCVDSELLFLESITEKIESEGNKKMFKTTNMYWLKHAYDENQKKISEYNKST